MKTNAERQAAFHQRKVAAGFVRHPEWVHKDDKKTLAEFAKKLREAAGWGRDEPTS